MRTGVVPGEKDALADPAHGTGLRAGPIGAVPEPVIRPADRGPPNRRSPGYTPRRRVRRLTEIVARRQTRSRGRAGRVELDRSRPARSAPRNTLPLVVSTSKNPAQRSSASRKSSKATSPPRASGCPARAAGAPRPRRRGPRGFSGIAAAQRHLRRQGRAQRRGRLAEKFRDAPHRGRIAAAPDRRAAAGGIRRRRSPPLGSIGSPHRGSCRRVRDCRQTSAARRAGRGRRDPPGLRRTSAFAASIAPSSLPARNSSPAVCSRLRHRRGFLQVAAPGAARSVTSRNVAVTSSSWKCGCSMHDATNTPGRPGRSRTVTRAGDQRKAGPHLRAGGQAGVDIGRQPALQPRFDFLGRLERAHHVAADDLDVVGKARDAEHRVDLRRKPRVGICRGRRRADIGRRRLQAAHRREYRLFAVGQRRKRHQPGFDQRRLRRGPTTRYRAADAPRRARRRCGTARSADR